MKKDTEMRAAAKRFADFWRGRGYDKGESQMFWTMLLRDVYGVEHPEEYITFEEQVKLDHTNFIDAIIKSTRVIRRNIFNSVPTGRAIFMETSGY